jgi:hypothetical protein
VRRVETGARIEDDGAPAPRAGIMPCRIATSLLLAVLFCGGPAVAADDDEAEPAVHVPEPMVFDLVRGLGAKRGEFELNVLTQAPLNQTGSRAIEWAPEVEYAVHDGVGLELELPFADGHLEAYKLAAQVTFSGLLRRRFHHGVQFIGEKVRGTEGVELSALYIPVVSFTPMWSTVTMIGARADVGDKAYGGETLLINNTLFFEPNRETAAGIELNLSAPRGEGATLLVMPQFYRELDEHWTIQAGVGALLGEDRVQWTAALRVIWGTEGKVTAEKTAPPRHALGRR